MGSLRERNPSLWVATTPDTRRYEPLERDIAVDAVVVGAGITGLTAGVLLRQEGLDVAIVEAGRLCSGTTGYTTAKVTSLHGLVYAELIARHGEQRARAYGDANQAGLHEVVRLDAELGLDCNLRRCAAYTYAETDTGRSAIEREVEAAHRLGLPARFTTETELPFPVAAAIRMDDQAQFHPRRFCVGLAGSFADAGGHLFEETRALDVETGPGGCTVRTDRGQLRTGHVVLATHLPFVNKGVFFARAAPYRSYALGVRLRTDAPTGMYLSAEQPVRSVRGTAEGVVLIGGESHKAGQDRDTRRRYDALEGWARTRFTVEDVPYRWSAHDFRTVDGMPYVGLLTAKEERVLVATGFRKWGMTNGTAAAMMLRDRIVQKPNPWSEAFDSTRREPRTSIRELLIENLDVAWRFVSDRVQQALPRSQDAPTCTHLGCALSFNTAERTWDCPCHGSRFGTNGRVIEGPAVRDLARVPPPPDD